MTPAEALDERIRNTRALPEQKILKRANDVYFQNEHYLYYKRRGNWVQIACSKCGGVTDVRWKAGESYESHFQRHVEVPQEGRTGILPFCAAPVEHISVKERQRVATARGFFIPLAEIQRKMSG